MQREIEDLPKLADLEALNALMTISKDYIFTLHIKQLLSHISLQVILDGLPNLQHLDLTYGYVKRLVARTEVYSARELGTEFEYSLFGMKEKDCQSLSQALKQHQLKVLQLSNNLIDDQKLSILMEGLMSATALTELGTLLV